MSVSAKRVWEAVRRGGAQVPSQESWLQRRARINRAANMFTPAEVEALRNPTLQDAADLSDEEFREELIASVQYSERRRHDEAEDAAKELAVERERIRQRGGFF